MICIRCDNEEFEERLNATIEQEMNGQYFKVQCPAMVCKMCGWMTVTLEQADVLFKRTIALHAKTLAERERKPPPIIGEVYKSKATGGIATLVKIHADGVSMKHRNQFLSRQKTTRQKWRTFFSQWKPLVSKY